MVCWFSSSSATSAQTLVTRFGLPQAHRFGGGESSTIDARRALAKIFALKEGKNGQRNIDPRSSWRPRGRCVRHSCVQDEEESSSIEAPCMRPALNGAGPYFPFAVIRPSFPQKFHRNLQIEVKTALTLMKQLFNVAHVDG